MEKLQSYPKQREKVTKEARKELKRELEELRLKFKEEDRKYAKYELEAHKAGKKELKQYWAGMGMAYMEAWLQIEEKIKKLEE